MASDSGPPFKVKDNLDPFGGVSVKSPRSDMDEAEPPAPASFPLGRKGPLVTKPSVVDDRHSGTASTVTRLTKANLPDSHFTPGTLQRDHDKDGYSKTNTRPTGQQDPANSGARQATAGTRGAAKRGGPFSDSND